MPKRWCEVSEAFAVLFSWICATVALACVFVNGRTVSLGYNEQIVVVGFLLSLMNLCTEKISTTVFLQLETRWQSSLQNFDIIIKRAVLASFLNAFKGSSVWSATLSLAVALPIGLSVAYKRFDGGYVTSVVSSEAATFGLTGPPGFDSFTSGSALMVNATIPFASSETTQKAYGFNMLVYDDAVAMLDAPSPSYIDRIKASLSSREARMIEADVFGLEWRPDPETARRQQDDDFWDAVFEGANDNEPKVVVMYKERYELATFWPESQTDRFFLFTAPRNDKTPTTRAEFQQGAVGFVSKRRRCLGKWRVTATDVALVDGLCGEELREPYPEDCTTLHLNDASYILGDFIGKRQTTNSDPATQQHFTAIVSALLWSRLAAYCGLGGQVELSQDERSTLAYDTAVSVQRQVPVMRQDALLAIVIIVQPTIALILLALRGWLSSSPISGGFGLVSLLAGYEKDEADILRGAGLSGSVKERIRLNIVEDPTGGEGGEVRLRYKIESAKATLSGKPQTRLRGRGVQYV